VDRAVIDGVTLEHEESGTGDPVVFIHGAFIAPAFRPLLSERALSDRYRLISYHRRGYVGSSRAEEPLSLAGQAGDCRRLLAHLGVQRAHVVGHSFGGVIALQLSWDAPQLRTVDDQRPRSSEEEAIVAAIRSHFADPHGFEACAAAIWAMYAPSTDYTLTAPSRDGGRDGYGYYKLGPESDPIRLDFALEAKCYGADNGVGVRDLSRLISRLRHRQFGVLVTTSYLAPQAYEELREDDHPVVVISARDIVDILKRRGISTATETEAWLRREFPKDEAIQD
jgi:pimeloyl-ACP methyl ester carboxylesterase